MVPNASAPRRVPSGSELELDPGSLWIIPVVMLLSLLLIILVAVIGTVVDDIIE